VLAIFVVYHSPRFITVKQEEEEEDVRHWLNNCDVWYFFGDTISKGKKNDHIFHNACLKDIWQRTSDNSNMTVGGFWIKQKYGRTIVRVSTSATRILWKLWRSQRTSAESSSCIDLRRSTILKGVGCRGQGGKELYVKFRTYRRQW
jgi:hypothetical protein